jgi:hypothetical protein
MMSEQQRQRERNEYFTDEDLRFIQVAIALALGNQDIFDMPKTKIALDGLSDKVERIYQRAIA